MRVMRASMMGAFKMSNPYVFLREEVMAEEESTVLTQRRRHSRNELAHQNSGEVEIEHDA